MAKETSFTLAFKKGGLLLDPDCTNYLFEESDGDDSEWMSVEEEDADSSFDEQDEDTSSEDVAVADLRVWEFQKRNCFSSYNELHQLFSVLHSWMLQDGPMVDDALKSAVDIIEMKPHLLKEHECVAQKTPLMVLWEACAPCRDYFDKVLVPLTTQAHQRGVDLNACDRAGRSVMDYCCWNLPPVTQNRILQFQADEKEWFDMCQKAFSFLFSMGAKISPFARLYFPQLTENGMLVWSEVEKAVSRRLDFATLELVSRDEAWAIARKAGLEDRQRRSLSRFAPCSSGRSRQACEIASPLQSISAGALHLF